MKLMSKAFSHMGMIPKRFTCDGEDVSPPLAWDEAPYGTRSFALVVEDSDAPGGSWDHWIAFNIPATHHELPEGMTNHEEDWDGTINGMNSWGHLGYEGPYPPSGMHHYHFKLYALNHGLTLPEHASKVDLMKAMRGHVLGEAEMVGCYQRN
jgi:Raf kinase inhibitor-like YbhB/YbcL family protein